MADAPPPWDLVHTLRQERVGAHRHAVLKSAIQKYVRRGERDKGLHALALMDSFRHLEAQAGGRAQALRTNMVNRLVAMMSEEVNVHEALLPAEMEKLHREWESARTLAASRRPLLQMYLLLLDARKSRVLSDLKTVYMLPPYYDKDRAHLRSLHARVWDAHRVPSNSRPTAHEQLTDAELLAGFGDLLSRGQLACFARLSAYLARHGAKRPALRPVWKVVRDAAAGKAKPLRDAVEALHYFNQRMTHQELPLYLYHAALLVAYAPRLDLTPLARPRVSREEIAQLYATPPERLQVNAYVLDVHTGAQGKTALDFATEGALVMAEDTRFLVQQHRVMYGELKELLVQKKPPTARIPAGARVLPSPAVPGVSVYDWPVEVRRGEVRLSSVRACMATTCGGKPMTYRAAFREGDWVFKRADRVSDGRLQLLADHLKPLAGLRQMGAARFRANWDIKATRTGLQFVDAPEGGLLTYLVFPDSRGEPLTKLKGAWEAEHMMEYLRIGIFRYGTLRFTDFNARNVLMLPDGKGLLSIDEMSVGRTRILSNASRHVLDAFQDAIPELLAIARRWQEDFREVRVRRVALACGYGHQEARQLAEEVCANMYDLPAAIRAEEDGKNLKP